LSNNGKRDVVITVRVESGKIMGTTANFGFVASPGLFRDSLGGQPMEVQTLGEWSVYYSDLIQAVRVIPKMEAGEERRERFCSRLFFFCIRYSLVNACDRITAAQRTVTLLAQINSVQSS
jgi:hypothetical protein